jgi:hypothetical protein
VAVVVAVKVLLVVLIVEPLAEMAEAVQPLASTVAHTQVVAVAAEHIQDNQTVQVVLAEVVPLALEQQTLAAEVVEY